MNPTNQIVFDVKKEITLKVVGEKMNKKENQRVRLTKRIFHDSLIQILKNKKIYQITVSELCNTAELNRSTFYKYYDNVYDVLTELEKEFIIETQNCINNIDASGINGIEKPLYTLLCHIKENAEAYELLINNSVNNNFSASIIRHTMDFLKYKVQALNIDLGERKDYLFEYIVEGSIAVMKVWIKDATKEPPEKISNIICDIGTTVLGIKNIME